MTAAGPVAVGAVGGSGTRVVARLLQELGISLGSHLNGALDNLVFTALFKTPSTVRRLSHDEQVSRARLFVRHESGGPLNPVDRLRLARAAVAATADEHPPPRSMLAGRRPTPRRWGWKEPNTQLFLPALVEAVEDLRYVHVLRHGLDMAFSTNDAQLRLFGPRLGVAVPADPSRLPEARLDWWIASTTAALAEAERGLAGRWLLCRFDELCAHPADESARLADFVSGSTPPTETLSRLASLVDAPPGMHRYRQHDLSVLRPDQIDSVADLGFPVERPRAT